MKIAGKTYYEGDNNKWIKIIYDDESKVRLTRDQWDAIRVDMHKDSIDLIKRQRWAWLRKIKTYVWEDIVVALILLAVFWYSAGRGVVEMIGSFAVFFNFCYAQVNDRMSETLADIENSQGQYTHTAECYRKSRDFYLAKELSWFVYFGLLHAWAALAGCGIFLSYSVWRTIWRRKHPRGRQE